MVEVGVQLAGDGLSDKRLATPRWAPQQQPSSHGLTEGLAHLRVLHGRKERHLETFLHVLHAANVAKVQTVTRHLADGWLGYSVTVSPHVEEVID